MSGSCTTVSSCCIDCRLYECLAYLVACVPLCHIVRCAFCCSGSGGVLVGEALNQLPRLLPVARHLRFEAL